MSVSAELGTDVYDEAVGFLKYELMLGTFADTFLLCLLLFIWLSHTRLPILLNANDRWQEQQRTLFGSFNGFTQDELWIDGFIQPFLTENTGYKQSIIVLQKDFTCTKSTNRKTSDFHSLRSLCAQKIVAFVV